MGARKSLRPLTEAYQRILPQSAAYKHIVLLTDGISEEGDTFSLTKEATANHVTISTVGLGQGRQPRLSGKSGPMPPAANPISETTPPAWSRILLRDVEEHTGSTAVEKTDYGQRSVKPAEILMRSAWNPSRTLRGYVRFQPRPTSDCDSDGR